MRPYRGWLRDSEPSGRDVVLAIVATLLLVVGLVGLGIWGGP